MESETGGPPVLLLGVSVAKQLLQLTRQPFTVQPSQSLTKLLVKQGWQPVIQAHDISLHM